ncbi:hypothetical protein C807_00289 [Lachnospiraceae bacterium 28-4]|nr:hypothetical protein C807_00289 [Lachnospiraceae bacterium 28-4]
MILINVTTNLKLGKPTSEEKYDIKVPNANMDIIDSNIKKLQDADRNFATNENLQEHTERRNNPHEVTKQQIGLDKVVNRQQIYGIPGAVTTGGIPVFDGNGYTVRDSGFTIGKSVPSHAVFTDTTYGIADDNAPGIIKPSDSIRVSSDGTASVADDSHSHDTQYYGKAEAALLHEKNLQDSKKYTDLKLSEHKAENTIQKQIVASLPTSGINTNTIYLVPKTDASTHDHYNEYINLTGDTNGWEFLGNTYIDLTDYYNKSEANRIFFLNSNISQSNENSTNKVPSSAFLYSIIQQKNSQIQNLQNEISEINSNLPIFAVLTGKTPSGVNNESAVHLPDGTWNVTNTCFIKSLILNDNGSWYEEVLTVVQYRADVVRVKFRYPENAANYVNHDMKIYVMKIPS